MLKTNQFILLKMIFDAELHDAVIAKDKNKIKTILNKNYEEEVSDRMFVDPELIDTEYLYSEYLKLNEEEMTSGSDYKWAL